MLLLQIISFQNWLELIIGIGILIPVYVYVKNYQRTRVLEFALFAFLGIIISINEFTLVIRDLIGISRLSEQIVDTCINLTIFIISIHALRVKWERPPVIILLLTYGGFIFMQFLVLFYEVLPVPERGFHIFMEMIKFGNTNTGAGVIIGNNIIHLNGYIFLVYVYGIFAAILYLYVYGTTKPLFENIRVNRARKLWMIAAFFIMLTSLIPIGHLMGFYVFELTLVAIFNFIALFIVIFVILRYPEVLLFSQTKILTLHSLYGKIESFTTYEQEKKFGMQSLVSYIKGLPSEIIELGEKELEMGLCIGSFSDKGFVIRGKNNFCDFPQNQLQSMLEYSGVLYQHGELEKLYGPFPQVKGVNQKNKNWNYFSFGFNTKDDTIVDKRIKESGGKILTILLLFYKQENDLLLSLYKKDLITILKSTIMTFGSKNPKDSSDRYLSAFESNIQSVFKRR